MQKKSVIFQSNAPCTCAFCTFWGLGITPKPRSGRHASVGTTQQSERLTLTEGKSDHCGLRPSAYFVALSHTGLSQPWCETPHPLLRTLLCRRMKGNEPRTGAVGRKFSKIMLTLNTWCHTLGQHWKKEGVLEILLKL